MQYTEKELNKIIEKHQHWIKEDCDGWENMSAHLEGANLEGAYLEGAYLYGANLEGAYLYGANLEHAHLERANLEGAYLYGANLEGAYLEGANLKGAYLKGAYLEGANLEGANLKGAYLEGANLEGANLEGAYLYGANLEGAYLYGANLEGAYLEGAYLEGANLKGAYLEGANLEEKEKFRLGQILKEPMIGYKKTKEGVVITATIPAGAIVFCINGSKCRTNKARIIDMGGQKEVLHSSYDHKFEYRLMQDIEIEDFNLMYNVECASGFHFFRTREEAEKYYV